MKKIDKLLITSFIGPFVVSFGIALFVLIMQFLWLYIDEIAGKGVSIFIMMELIGYLSISTFPLALPIAILIASVMVMGNLAERYELSSMKSAGVPLIRIMRGLIISAAAIGFFSYLCSDFIIPIANLEFKTRLTDIRRQKPALALEKGIFNEDFRQFVIRIGDKESDGETISNVMIEDQTNAGRVKFNKIMADSGQMFTTENRRFFVMNLFNGTQYQEPGTVGDRKNDKYPFIRTNFGSWTKVWDMKEFEMVSSDKDRFAGNRSFLSMNQLRANIDSLQQVMESGKQAIADDLLLNLKRQPVKPRAPTINRDSLERVRQIRQQAEAKAKGIKSAVLRKQEMEAANAKPVRKLQVEQAPLNKPLGEYGSFLETFPQADRAKLMKDGFLRARSGISSVETRKAQIENRRTEYVKTGYELYIKYSFALVCFIFLFIGAPMGAIIRKGGFGYPILVSIIFFVTFIMLTIMCRKLAESYIMTPFWAAMVPCLTLIPVGAFLTRKAMNDSQMFSTDRLDRFLRRMRERFNKQKAAEPA
ncbi:MAG: LptF/LptG family permease [Lewinellaceae bacterium]|nr:LptF/LptG family permease [Saprospiraceae bacterium]MCB9305423.1 LptF/LptG family permease [Lewinellaceae bacterium]MCB9356158.1 LptF/LptG family permease [Lewinellaceae bacterium]